MIYGDARDKLNKEKEEVQSFREEVEENPVLYKHGITTTTRTELNGWRVIGAIGIISWIIFATLFIYLSWSGKYQSIQEVILNPNITSINNNQYNMTSLTRNTFENDFNNDIKNNVTVYNTIIIPEGVCP
jgi:hypothetical protein